MHHFGGVSVRIDDFRDHVIAGCRIFGGEVFERIGDVHRRIPAHIRHIHEQDINAVRVALGGVGDDHMHHAVRCNRRVP